MPKVHEHEWYSLLAIYLEHYSNDLCLLELQRPLTVGLLIWPQRHSVKATVSNIFEKFKRIKNIGLHLMIIITSKYLNESRIIVIPNYVIPNNDLLVHWLCFCFVDIVNKCCSL